MTGRYRRLTALDASFLTTESDSAHMHVGWAAVFAPPEDAPPPSFAELRDHIAARLGRAPRYRQRLAPDPLSLEAPAWIDDADFDITRHVRRQRAEDLDEVADTVMSTPLDRERPLWEIAVADRLADGRVGIVGKAHHCMVDGIAAVELAALLLDPSPDPPVGCRLEAAFPVVPLAEGHEVSVGITTVAGRACFGIYADPAVVPDAHVLATGIDEDLATLLAAAKREEDGHRRHRFTRLRVVAEPVAPR